MMFGVLNGAKIAVLVATATAVGIGYWYIQKLQTDLKIMQQNQVVLETAVESKSSEIERLNENIQEIKEVNTRIKTQSDALNAEVSTLRNKLSEHDLGFLAENKPGLIEKIINKDIQKNLREGLKEIMEND
jgi:peptidoglycan hydrolase CwlO-like protein